MGNSSNSKNLNDYSLSKQEVETIKSTWQTVLSKGINECGIGLMTRLAEI